MSDLGRLVKEYRTSRAQLRRTVLLSLGSFAASALIFAIAWGSEHASLGNRIGLSVLATVFGLPGAIGVYVLARGYVAVNLHERGLACLQRGKERRATWEEIASLIDFKGLRLVKGDGEVLAFSDGLEDYLELGERVEAETLQRLLPAARAVLAAGGRVAFPGLTAGAEAGALEKAFSGAVITRMAPQGLAVDRQGLHFGEGIASIAWTDVTEVGLAEGTERPWAGWTFFFVRATGDRYFECLWGTLGNAHVLYSLAKELTGRGVS